MNKAELVVAVADECGLTKKDAEKAVDVVFKLVQKELVKGESVKISNFGVFQVKHRKERKGTSPVTQKEIVIPATKTVGFKPSKTLKEAVK
ncbi:MAG: HU family DNA-binding protein [Bacilli bacterium]